MTTKIRIAWDSTVLIDAIRPDPKWWPELEPIYQDALRGKVEIIVSEISVAEVCKLNGAGAAGMTHEEVVKKIRAFFLNKFIERRPADRRESALAAELIRTHNLETCDAIIAATASVHHANILYTRDGLKKRRQNKPSLLKCDGKIGQPPLCIKPPCAADYLGLPLLKEINQNKSS